MKASVKKIINWSVIAAAAVTFGLPSLMGRGLPFHDVTLSPEKNPTSDWHKAVNEVFRNIPEIEKRLDKRSSLLTAAKCQIFQVTSIFFFVGFWKMHNFPCHATRFLHLRP